VSEVAIIDGNERLPQLARKINEAHASVEAQLNQVEQHKGYALEQAVAVGDALNEAKASLSHGQFQPWLDENCPNVKRTQVTDYMRLARAVADGQLQITRAGNLSIRDAVKQLSAPQKTLKGDNQLSPPQQSRQSAAAPSPTEGAAQNVDVQLIVTALQVYDAHPALWGREKVIARFMRSIIDGVDDNQKPLVLKKLTTVFSALLRATGELTA